MNKKLLIIGLLAATVLQSCVSYIKTVGEEPIKKSFESGEAARVFTKQFLSATKPSIPIKTNQSVSR